MGIAFNPRFRNIIYQCRQEQAMNEDIFNMSIRRFLKNVGVHSQAQIERAVATAVADGKLKGNESFPARMELTIDTINLSFTLDGEIKLE